MAAQREGVWDRAARGYARQEHLELRAIGRALDWAAPARHEELLDVATGTGLVLRELARRAERPARAVGVDASPGMLARVGALPGGWRAVGGDATALPFGAASFDVAVAAYLLQVLTGDERGAALAEVARVVRPAGRLVLVTPWARSLPGRAVLALPAAAAPATLGGLMPHDPRGLLAAAGWRAERAALVRGGYPSLVVLARRA